MHCLAARGMAALAALLLLAALWKPWMEVPIDISELPDGTVKCVMSRPRSALPFRIACAGFALVMGAGHAWHRRTSDRKAILAGAFLSSQLFFPNVVMAWEPLYSARASWMQIQHENLVWLGGDLCTNLEFSRKSWKDQIYMVDTPRQINVMRMPSSGLGAFQFGRLMTWFENLGYSNRFCQFVRMGWICAIIGTFILIVSECLPGGKLNRRRMARAGLAAMAVFLIGSVVATVPIVFTSLELDACRDDVARGRYDAAAEHLRKAVKTLPAFQEDTFYVAQMGLIDHRRGRRDSDFFKLFEANLRERQGRYAQAMDGYQEVIRSTPKDSAVHREALRAVLRAGLHALNGQKNEQARVLLEQVLGEEPCNLKANYALQLACLRTGRRSELECLVKRLVATYGAFQMPTKAIVMASSYENAMIAALREHDIAAVESYSAKSKKP